MVLRHFVSSYNQVIIKMQNLSRVMLFHVLSRLEQEGHELEAIFDYIKIKASVSGIARPCHRKHAKTS